jgi:hypothetical protein
VDGADFVPENAIPVFSLSQNGSATGKLTIPLHKILGIDLQVGRNLADFLLADIGTAESFAAFSALGALEYRIGSYRFASVH